MSEGPIWPFDEHDNISFDNGKDIHERYKLYEPAGYMYDLDLRIVSHYSPTSFIWHIGNR
jgi:hypothetical protein